MSADHDPLLGSITAYVQTVECMACCYGGSARLEVDEWPGEGCVVKWSDLPALIARVRADEQAKIAAEFAQQPFIPHTGLWLTYRQIEGLTVLMRRDERRQARQRVEVYADDTHPAHGKREACPRCDITAVLRHVAATVIGGES